MDRNSEAVKTFNKHASAYNERFGSLDLYNDTYELFSSMFPNRFSTVLDVACGPGNITNYLLRKRPDLKITGIDLAPNMVEIARVNNPGATFEVMDCREVSKLNVKFDAIVCGFAIPYLSKEETEKLIADCGSLLNPGGFFYFSLIDGKYENSDYQYASNNEDRSYVYFYNSVKIMSMLAKNNLRIVQVEDFTWNNNKGNAETHLVFIVAKT
jgi:predicted TPR repeat methyltransferase